MGMPVYTYDAHGHGRSEPRGPFHRALVRSFQHLVDDVLDFTCTFVVHAEQQHSNINMVTAGFNSACASDPSGRPSGPKQEQRGRPRVFLLGYSMGGLVSCLAVAETASPSQSAAVGSGSASSVFEGLMLTSGLTDPFYGNHPVLRALKVLYVTALSWLAPALPLFKRRPVESGIRDPVSVAAMSEDMLWYRGRFKVRTLSAQPHCMGRGGGLQA